MSFDFAQYKQRGFVPILIVIAVAALAGGYFVYTNSQTKTPAPTIQPSPSPSDTNPAPAGSTETATWKTYTNTKLKFSFRYPEDYKFEKEDNEKATFSGTFQPGNQLIPSELVVYFQSTLDLHTLGSCEDIQLQDNVITSCIDGEVTTKNVNGLQMNVFHITTGSKNSQAAISYVYQAISKPQIEFIHKVIGGGIQPRVDQILSTFKFTR